MLYFWRMKQTLINLLVALSTFSCVAAQAQQSLVVVLDEKNAALIDAPEAGNISYKDKGFKTSCNYDASIDYLKEAAAAKGANLVKITRHKTPDAFNSCHRFDADFYKTDNPRLYEKEVIWSEKRKLDWADFRAENPPHGYNATALTYCGISYSVKNLNELVRQQCQVFC